MKKKLLGALIGIMMIVTASCVIFAIFMFYCLDRERPQREFRNHVENTKYVWEAQEIDCTLYSKETIFYTDIKEKYEIDSEYENEEAILGVLKWEGKETPVMFCFTGPGSQGYLAEVYYNPEKKAFDSYTDVMVGGYYDMNFWKNKITLEVDDYYEAKDNALNEYLKEQNIEKITFVKNTEKNETVFSGTIGTNSEATVYERYENTFGVTVLSAKYDKDKMRMEILIQNTKNYDITEGYSLAIGIIGKTRNSLCSKWLYEDILPYEEGYMVYYYGNETIPAESKKKVIISDINDNEIEKIKAIVSCYEYEGKYWQNPAQGYFQNMVDQEGEQYFIELYHQE